MDKIVAKIFPSIAGGPFGMILSFALSMVASAIVSKIFAPDTPKNTTSDTPDPGQRQTVSPAGNNKLPVVYGTAWCGGVITDLTITTDNQTMLWCVALSEVTNTDANSVGVADSITFGDIYWGGKKCIFDATDKTKVISLQDPSTSEVQDVSGYLNIYLYNNGSYSGVNTSSSAISIMGQSGLTYIWGGDKLMSNCCFAIVKLKYSQSRNLTGLPQLKFELTNSRKDTGDCFYDYLVSSRYGAAIDPSLIDTASLTALTTYSNQNVTYTTYTGSSSTIKRYQFDGTIDTNQKIMNNIQIMADCCNCLVRYNEITGQWGVVVQQPTYTVAMDLNDSNIISGIAVTPIDLSNSFNIIEAKFPDGTQNDAFASATFDLAVLNPALLFPNEPVNKQTVNLNLVNSDVRAQYLANIMLEGAREDLQVQFDIDYTGLQLQAGDIVTVTNANFGWVAKPFRLIKVTQKFNDGGQVFATLSLTEFNSAVYDDKNVTQFTPAPNSGLPSPITFGTIPAPTVGTILPNAVNPAFNVNVTSSSSGIVEYAEVWYSAYQYPTDSQRIFAGITEVQSNGNPYGNSIALPPVQLFNIPAGNWYFFSRMVNAIAKSSFSLASAVLNWRPTTFQFTQRYLAIAYADDISGGGFSLDPRGKQYYGLYNSDSTSAPLTASSYNWYLADPLFGTNIYLVYINYGTRRFGFDTDFAMYAGGSGAFVPSTTSKFDFRLWSALEDGTNYIDLDVGTGQVTKTGTTTVSTGQVAITNAPDGKLVASLAQFLDFGGAQTYTGSAANITIDIYGRIVGFAAPDDFFYSRQDFTATSGQTVFTPTARAAGYITGQDLIFQNGELLSTSDYTESSTTFTLNTGAVLGDIITCISMRAVSSAAYYENTGLIVQSTSGNDAIYSFAQLPQQTINAGDKFTFSNTGTPTQYTVTGVNYATRTITFSTNPTATTGDTFYRYRAAGASYPVFSRWEFDLSGTSSYLPTEWAFDSGFELPFLNGTIVNEQDYDLVSGAITNFPAIASGKMTIIQFSMNNLTTPTGTMANVVAYSVNGQTIYSFTYTSVFDLYANGCLLKPSTDYSTGTNTYTMTSAFDNNTTLLVQQTFASQGAA